MQGIKNNFSDLVSVTSLLGFECQAGVSLPIVYCCVSVAMFSGCMLSVC